MKTTQNTLFLFSFLCLAPVGISACGSVKTAKSQSNPNLTAPVTEDGNTEPFRLSDAGKVSYSGSLLVWNPTVTPELIRNVSDASVNGRLAKADLKIAQQRLADLSASHQQKQEVLAVVNHRIRTIEQESSSLQRPLAESWLSDRLATLQRQQAISAADAAEATSNFAAYCEYKVWELATSVLLDHPSVQRPTPLAMCEPYYAAQGYLAKTQPACADAAAAGDRAATKDYFNCLWEEGVLKTKLYTSFGEQVCGGTGSDAANKRIDVVRGWLANGVLRAALQDRQPAEASSPKRFDEILRKDFLLNRAAFKADPRFERHQELLTCKKAFRYEINADDGLFGREMSDLKAMVEGDPSAYMPIMLLPSLGDGAADSKRWQLVAQPLGFFAARPDDAISINDRLFNQVVSAAVYKTASAFEDAFDKSEAFKAITALAEAPADLLAGRKVLQEELKALATKVEAAREASVKADTTEKLAVQASAMAGAAPGAALLVNGLGLTVLRNASQLTVILGFSGSSVALANCVGLGSDPTACMFDARLLGLPSVAKPQGLIYNQETGSLKVEVALDDLNSLKSLGLAPLARGNGAFFNDLNAEQLEGRTLSLEFFPDRLNGVLDFFTGKAFIKYNGVNEFEGSMSGTAN